MNVASKELCEQLYKLSRWGGANPVASYETGLMWYYGDNYQFIALDYSTWTAEHRGKRQRVSGIPAYDLGFILRKLPRRFTVTFDLFDDRVVIDAYYGQDEALKIEAETPEDCAVKLAIKLFQQNILQRSTQGVSNE